MKPRIPAVAIVLLGLLVAAGALAEGDAQQQTQQQSEQRKSTKKAPRLDVVFAIDATGSMGDEIEVIKKEVWTIANELISGKPTPDIRFGLVFYKDKSDGAELVRSTPLTRDVDEIHSLLMSARVGGGGDGPEHVGRGLHEAVGMEWDTADGVSRTIYLVGDAVGHSYQDHTIASALSQAAQKNITIHAIGASGIESGGGDEQFAMIASRTDGRFERLTYHAIVKGDDGRDKSVVYADGKTYEADEVITDKEWKAGAKDLISSGKVKPAEESTKRRARRAKKRNNLDSVVTDSVKSSAAEMGVAY